MLRYKTLKWIVNKFISRPSLELEEIVDKEIQTFERRLESFNKLPHHWKQWVIECNDPILEIGCGEGGLIYGISQICKKPIIGIELDSANAKKSSEIKGAAVLQADGELLPFRSESIRLVFLIEVVEHVNDIAKVLLEVHRVLKSDGIAIVTFPSFLSIKGPHLFHLIPIPWAQFIFGRHTLRRVAVEELQKINPNVTSLDHLNEITIQKFLQTAIPLFDLQQLRVRSGFKVMKPIQFIPYVDDFVADSVRVVLRRNGSVQGQSIRTKYLTQKYFQLVDKV